MCLCNVVYNAICLRSSYRRNRRHYVFGLSVRLCVRTCARVEAFSDRRLLVLLTVSVNSAAVLTPFLCTNKLADHSQRREFDVEISVKLELQCSIRRRFCGSCNTGLYRRWSCDKSSQHRRTTVPLPYARLAYNSCCCFCSGRPTTVPCTHRPAAVA